MKRLTQLGFAIFLVVAALAPGSSEAACTLEQCIELLNNTDCSQHVCPQGFLPVPRCNAIYCYAYCTCMRCSTNCPG